MRFSAVVATEVDGRSRGALIELTDADLPAEGDVTVAVDSESPSFAPGDEVVATGWGLSKTHPGGYTRRQRLRSACSPSSGLASVPNTDGEVLVTGAAGGVERGGRAEPDPIRRGRRRLRTGGGNELPVTVLPFMLRGVRLLGVESVRCPNDDRLEAWHRLARDLPVDVLDSMTTVEPLTRVPQVAEAILEGRTRGRVVIDVNG